MAGPKGQPYVDNTYGWPEGPAIIPRDSYLGRRPSMLINGGINYVPEFGVLGLFKPQISCESKNIYLTERLLKHYLLF